MRKYLSLLLSSAALAGCAATPDVSYNYYLPTSQTTVSVTQTISCTDDKKDLIFTYSAPQVSTEYYADTSKSYPLPVKQVASNLSDNTLAFNRTIDGRLTSINAAWTGQGETIVSSAISLAKAAAVIGGGSGTHALDRCTVMKNWGDGKSVSLTYSGTLDLATTNDVDLTAGRDETSQKIYAALDKDPKDDGSEPAPRMPRLRVEVTRSSPDASATYNGSPQDYKVWLTLRKTVNARFELKAQNKTIFTSSAVVPTADTFTLPVPGGEPFGTNTFAITLNDAGGISEINYDTTNGTASALNTAGNIVTAATPAPTSTTTPPPPTTTP